MKKITLLLTLMLFATLSWQSQAQCPTPPTPDYTYCYDSGEADFVFLEVAPATPADLVTVAIYQGSWETSYDNLTVYEGAMGSGITGAVVMPATDGDLSGTILSTTVPGNYLIFVSNSDGSVSCANGSQQEFQAFDDALPTVTPPDYTYCYDSGESDVVMFEIPASAGNVIQAQICQGNWETTYDSLTVYQGASGSGTTGTIVFGPSDGDLSGSVITSTSDTDVLIFVSNSDGSVSCAGGQRDSLELNYVYQTAPSCPDVINLNASNFVAPGSADLSWDAAAGATGYNWEIQPQGTAQGDAALVEDGNVATNMASATMLVDGTAYTLYVQSDCGGAVGNYVSYDFTFVLPPANDDCSGVIDLGTLMSPHSASTAGANNNFNQDCLTNVAAPDVVYSLVVPDGYTIDIGQDSNAYDSKHRLAYGASCPGDMLIDCIDDQDTDRITWQNTTGSEQTVYWIQSAYATGSGDYVLSWTLTPPPCSDPTNLTAMNITDSAADLGWTVGADGESMWDVEWGALGFAVGTGAEIGSANDTMDNPLNVTGLTASTDYEFYVKAVCFATVESAWVGPFAFTTLAPQPPANDNVCDAIEIIVDADSTGDAFTDELATAEANEVIGSCLDSGINSSVWFTFVAPAGGEVQVTTDIVGGTHTDTEIAVYEAPTDCADASTLGAELGCDQDGGDTGSGWLSYLELTGLTVGNTYYIQVDRWGSAATGTFGLEVNTPPACPDVANLSASNFLPAGTADLAWDAAVGATGYNWEIQPQGTAQGTAGAIDMGNVATNAAMASNLVADAMYTLYVQSDCGGGALGNFIALDFTFILPPSNDNCATPVVLTVGTSSNQNVVMGNNTSTSDSGEVAPSCASYAGGDMWYSAIVPANGNMIIETMPVNGGDGGLAVYSGTCGALTELACNDDDGDGLFGLIELTGLTPGDTLLIRVWQYGNNAIIDFEVVAYSPNCPDVANLSASNFVAPSSADLAWDVAAGAAGYNWEIQPQGTAQGTAGAIDMGSVVTNAATTANLVDGTAYTLYVQSDCGGGALGNWISQDFTFVLPPVNDTFAGAIPITPSPEGTGCGTATFTLPFSTDGTTDSGLDSSCLGTNSGLDQFFTWTATTNALTWVNQAPGNPGIAVYDAAGNEIACYTTFTDGVLQGWNVGDNLVIQISDFAGSLSDVSFCLEELNIMVALPDCPTLLSPLDGAVDVLSPVILDWDAATTGDPADSYNVYVSINGGAEFLFNNYTATETPAIGLQPDLTVVWRVVPVNAAGENTACTTAFSFSSVVGTDDYDGDGVDNLTEYDPNNDGDLSDATDMNDPCDPVQVAGYTGYDSSNAIWLAEDCDGDGQTNQVEFNGGSDPYDNTSVVSVDDLEAVGFTYYPNPVKDELTMTANENIKTVTIFNMLGQEVLLVAPSSMETTVNVARLANGTYFVKAEVGDAVGTFKVVKN